MTKKSKKEVQQVTNENKVLVLRNCAADMTAYGGFKWPESGEVSAADWNPEPVCGGGLHGFLWGQGDYSNFNKAHDAKWLVVEVLESEIVKLDHKVKFPRGKVVYCGNWPEAFAFIRNARPKQEKYASTATGDSGHAAATGYSGHAAATGNSGHAAATGNSGHAAATGDSGHAAATGNSGHAAATGNSGIACCLGQNSKVKAGDNGAIIATYWDGNRFRIVVGYVGEDGIKKDVLYRLNESNKFEEVVK